MNKLMVALFCVCTGGSVLAFPVAGRADSVEEVHQLLDRIEKAWDRQDIEAYRQCLHEDVLTIRSVLKGLKEGAWVFNKKDGLERIAGLWKRAGLKRRFVGRDISVRGDIARMRLNVADRATGRRYAVGEFLALAVRRNGAWKMCFSMPRFVRPVVLVTEVLPSSQAERVGIKAGDVLSGCGTWSVEDSATLRRWVKARAGEEAHKKSPLVVIRGNEYLRFEVAPGELGVRLEDRLLPTNGAVLVKADQPHPIKEIVQAQLAALKANDVKAWFDCLCLEGYLSVGQSESGPPAVTTRGNFREKWEEELPSLREKFDFSALEYRDSRLIVAGDVALASSRVRVVRRGEEPKQLDTPSRLGVFVRKNDRWWLAAVLPNPKGMEIGLHVRGEYYSAEETAQREAWRRGRFLGVGLDIRAHAEGIRIKKVLPDSGAARAGLKGGEIITEIEGQPAAGMSAKDAVKLLKGPEGTTVDVTVRSEAGESRTVRVIRATIVISGVESRVLSDNIGLIEIKSFTVETAPRVRGALEEFSAHGVVGLVLDLREGGGGPLKEMVKVIDLFVPRGRTLFYMQNRGEELKAVKSKEKPATKLPMVVLIDTKSGGELVGAALKRNRRATLVGHKTPGVTANKQMVKHPDGSSEVVVRAHFLVTQRTPITGRGVEPDVRMGADATPEEVLDEGIRLLRAKLEP